MEGTMQAEKAKFIICNVSQLNKCILPVLYIYLSFRIAKKAFSLYWVI